jgi:hypothetical protein
MFDFMNERNKTKSKLDIASISNFTLIMEGMSKCQLSALELISECESIGSNDSRIHGNTLNSLQYKRLIVCWNYANGSFYKLSDLGYSVLANRE